MHLRPHLALLLWVQRSAALLVVYHLVVAASCRFQVEQTGFKLKALLFCYVLSQTDFETGCFQSRGQATVTARTAPPSASPARRARRRGASDSLLKPVETSECWGETRGVFFVRAVSSSVETTWGAFNRTNSSHHPYRDSLERLRTNSLHACSTRADGLLTHHFRKGE